MLCPTYHTHWQRHSLAMISEHERDVNTTNRAVVFIAVGRDTKDKQNRHRLE